MIQQAIDRMHLPLGIALLEIDVSAGLVAVIAHGPLGAARHQIRPGAFLTTPPLLLDAALAAAQHAIDGALTLSEI